MRLEFGSLTHLFIAVTVAVCCDSVCAQQQPSNLKTDETILFFPTFGRFEQPANVWRLNVHGKVYEPEFSSTKRDALIAILQRSANVSFSIGNEAPLNDRLRPFLVDNERGKSVTITVAGKKFAAGISAANGHFSKTLVLRADVLGPIKGNHRVEVIEAVLPRGDSRKLTGQVHLIAPQGISVISDIDDTIKHSQVTDKSELIQNTFLRPFRHVDGMPALYTRLSKMNVCFHYVSGSPWQLYKPLRSFIVNAGFPTGTFHLKQFRLKDSRALELFASQEGTKLAAITPLLKSFPDRRFILIGDSGEQDPEIYGRIAREYPDQVIGIYIRNVTKEKRGDARFITAFEDVPSDRCVLFDDVSAISDRLLHVARTSHR